MTFKNNNDSIYKPILDKTKLEKRLGMHSFHRYYGKLIPAIPRAFIREFTNENDLVHDPFCGSGTTALESLYLKRNFIGFEINPLSVSISRIKTCNYSVSNLNVVYENLKLLVAKDNGLVLAEDLPFCVNRDHWFRTEVQKDLVILERNIQKSIDFLNPSEQISYREFLVGTISAVVKSVSNADTMHVFPGISKRVRALEAEGKITKNVFDTYFRALRKRIGYVEEIGSFEAISKIYETDASTVDVSEFQNTIDLIVTNPPYISSVRYAETLKLELYWMGITKSQKEYLDLSTRMIGNDSFKKEDYVTKKSTRFPFINDVIDNMYLIDAKNARVLFDYFTLMDSVIRNMSVMLKPEKKVVMKISDSKIRKVRIETGRLLTLIAETYGFELDDVFTDKINENSRSLLTSRNTYSDIIVEDHIIIWVKK